MYVGPCISCWNLVRVTTASKQQTFCCFCGYQIDQEVVSHVNASELVRVYVSLCSIIRDGKWIC